MTGWAQLGTNGHHMACGRVVRKLDWSELCSQLANASYELTLPTGPDVDEIADAFIDILVNLCDHTMPRRTLIQGRKSVHWWSEEIAELRRTSCSAASVASSDTVR